MAINTKYAQLQAQWPEPCEFISPLLSDSISRQSSGLYYYTFLDSLKNLQSGEFITGYLLNDNDYVFTCILKDQMYYTLNLETFDQKQIITGDRTSAGFGDSISINSDGSIIVMGGRFDGINSNGFASGSAIIYTGNPSYGWKYKQKIRGDGDGPDFFGKSTSINNSGNVIIVGSTADYVKVMTGDLLNNWELKQKIVGSGGSFGFSLATNYDSSIIMVGAPSPSINNGSAGGVLIYTGGMNNSPIGWRLKQRITGGLSNTFGFDVSCSNDGNIIVMGGSIRQGVTTGAAMIFTGNATGGWQLKQSITGINTEGYLWNSLEGWRTATNNNGNVIVVGGPTDNGINGGTVYIYTGNANNGWQLKQTITGNTTGVSTANKFGNSLSINGDGSLIAIGSPYEDLSVTNAGAAFLYTGNANNGWELKQTVLGDGVGDNFGYDVTSAINKYGNVVAVSAVQDDIAFSNAGSTVLYTSGILSSGIVYTSYGGINNVLEPNISGDYNFISTGNYAFCMCRARNLDLNSDFLIISNKTGEGKIEKFNSLLIL